MSIDQSTDNSISPIILIKGQSMGDGTSPTGIFITKHQVLPPNNLFNDIHYTYGYEYDELSSSYNTMCNVHELSAFTQEEIIENCYYMILSDYKIDTNPYFLKEYVTREYDNISLPNKHLLSTKYVVTYFILCRQTYQSIINSF